MRTPRTPSGHFGADTESGEKGIPCNMPRPFLGDTQPRIHNESGPFVEARHQLLDATPHRRRCTCRIEIYSPDDGRAAEIMAQHLADPSRPLLAVRGAWIRTVPCPPPWWRAIVPAPLALCPDFIKARAYAKRAAGESRP